MVFTMGNNHISDYIKGSAKIAQKLFLDSDYIVRIETEPGDIFNENVLRINVLGEVVWKISTVPHLYADSPYTHVDISDGKLVAFNWDSHKVDIDTESGKIIREVQAR